VLVLEDALELVLLPVLLEVEPPVPEEVLVLVLVLVVKEVRSYSCTNTYSSGR
jgi:hypothetical protein